MTPSPDWTIEPASATPLSDGQRIPQGDGHIEVMHTPGHTMGSICLRYGRYLFSGDTLLPDISPNVGGGDVQHRELLRHYLASLARIRDLSQTADLQVMPGHGDPMPTFADRCDALIRHHNRRLDEIVAILDRRGGLTVYELARTLFGKMEGFHVVLGCAEAFAHLELLLEQGRVSQSDGKYFRE
jgi:hydroxyacylglutathione hydrolase